MLQFLPMIMSLLESKKKDEQAANQNSAAAMLGQAPTAQGGGSMWADQLARNGAPNSQLLQESTPEKQKTMDALVEGPTAMGPYGQRRGGLSDSTNSMLDSALAGMNKKHKEPDADDMGGPSDNDEDDKDLLSM